MGSGKQLPDGTIVRAPQSVFGDRVYFVSHGRRHWICDASWFEQHGRVWPDDVRDISPELLASFLPGGPAPRAWTEEDKHNPSADLGSLALREIAGSRLQGMGVEFGAGASPFPVPLQCRVLFADRLAHVELCDEVYPGQTKEDLVDPDLVTDFESCANIVGESLDFVIACHVIEHTRNPIGAIVQAWKRLRPGGSLVLAVPVRDRTFDRHRAITPLSHLITDFELPERARDYAHYEDFYAHAFASPTPNTEQRSMRDSMSNMPFTIMCGRMSPFSRWSTGFAVAPRPLLRCGPTPEARTPSGTSSSTS